MSDNSWFRVGFKPNLSTGNVPTDTQVKDWDIRRFFVKVDEPKEFIFADDQVFGVWEHNPKMNGKWDSHFTCLQGTGVDCPVCQVLGDKTRCYVGYYTVIDCSEWTDKKGVKHQYELKYFPAKTKTLKKLHKKKESAGTLVGMKFKADRTDKKSPNVGDDFEFVEKVDMTKMASIVTLWGTPLQTLYNTADSDKEQMEKLRKILELTLSKEKTVKEKIPSFNYYEQLKPRAVAELKALTKDMEADTGTPTAEHKVEEVPF